MGPRAKPPEQAQGCVRAAVLGGSHSDMRGGFQPQFPLADPKRDVFPAGLIVNVTELKLGEMAEPRQPGWQMFNAKTSALESHPDLR